MTPNSCQRFANSGLPVACQDMIYTSGHHDGVFKRLMTSLIYDAHVLPRLSFKFKKSRQFLRVIYSKILLQQTVSHGVSVSASMCAPMCASMRECLSQEPIKGGSYSSFVLSVSALVPSRSLGYTYSILLSL